MRVVEREFASYGHGGRLALRRAASLRSAAAGETDVAEPKAGLGKFAIRPWRLWHLLSLDAPTVAVTWCLLFAQAAHTALAAGKVAVLAACVWLIYVCDRIADALRLPSPLLTRERHWFHGRHKWKLALAGGAVFALALNWSLHNFDTVVLRSGLGLTSMVVVYLVLVQLGWLKPVWKEAVVGVLFAAGTSLPVWTRGAGADAELVLGTGCFAVLCWINCVAIEYWETHRSTTSAGEESRLLQLVGRRLPIAAAILGFASLAVWSAIPRHDFGEIFGACVLSCAALAALDGYRNSFSTARLRILADVALLTPLLFLRGFPR